MGVGQAAGVAKVAQQQHAGGTVANVQQAAAGAGGAAGANANVQQGAGGMNINQVQIALP